MGWSVLSSFWTMIMYPEARGVAAQHSLLPLSEGYKPKFLLLVASVGAATVEEETNFLGNLTQSEPGTQGPPDAAVTPLLASCGQLLQQVPAAECCIWLLLGVIASK